MVLSWLARQQEGSRPGEPILFLPGWGFSGAILSLAAGDLPWGAPDTLLDAPTVLDAFEAFLESSGRAKVHLVGWSLGAQLALDCARRFPDRVASLQLLAMRASWPAVEIASIRAGLAAEPHAFMADFYRKCFLGYRTQYRRFLAEQQEGLLARLDPALLGRGLDYLASWRRPVTLPPCPVVCWHGRRDVIAPVAERAALAGAEERILEHGGHALFLDQEFHLFD